MKCWGDEKDQYRQDGLELLRLAGLSSNHNKDDIQTQATYSQIGSKKLLDLAIEKGSVKVEGTEQDGLIRTKCMSEQTICGNWSYLAGLMAGYFDADGHVIFNPEKGSCIRLTSKDLKNLRLIQNALHAFGIQSKIYQER